MPVNYWLFKSEPTAYSYDHLVEDYIAEWDGVRNFQARNFLRDNIKVNDLVLFYHSNANPIAVIGTAIVIREGYPDHTAWGPDSDHPDPKGTLDITASNQATPSNTDGIIIPRIDAFPATDPGADQNSMLVYLTTTSGTNTPGFYYWDNTTTSWLPISSSTQDFDWLEQGTTTPPDANTDNIFTVKKQLKIH